MEDLTEAYLSIYENHDDLNEVKGFGGHVDPNTGKSSGLRSPSQQAHATHWRNKQQGKDVADPRRSKFKYGGSKKSTTGAHDGDHPEDFAKKQDPDLAMTPAKRMETRATAVAARGDTKRANKFLMEDLIEAYLSVYESSHLGTDMKKRAKDNEDAVKEIKDTEAHKEMAKTAAKKFDEEFDSYDVILNHLLDEGFADTEQNAITIMANMSEAWKKEIMHKEKKHKEEKKSD